MPARLNVDATVSVFDREFPYGDAVVKGKPGPVTGRLKRTCRAAVRARINED